MSSGPADTTGRLLEQEATDTAPRPIDVIGALDAARWEDDRVGTFWS